MPTDSTLDVCGVPNDKVTHWGISRLDRGKWERLSAPNESGAHLREWPLEVLDLDFVRETWGPGEYRTHWLAEDPTAADPSDRRKSQGNGRVFRLDPLPEPELSEVPATTAAAPSMPTGELGTSLSFAMQMMQLADRRTESQIQAIAALAGVGVRAQAPAPAVDPAIAAQLAALQQSNAALQAEVTAERIRREEREKAAEAIRRAEDETRRLRDRVRDLEREADAVEAPQLTPGGGGILEQLGLGLANFALKNPGLVAQVAAPILAAVQSSGAPTPSPSAPPAPRPPPALHGANPSAAHVASQGAQAHMPSQPIAPSPPAAATVPVTGPNGAPQAPARVPVAPPPAAPPSAPAAPQAAS